MSISPITCSSCGACANACVHGAISMQLDTEGFYRPVIDAEKCVECRICEKVCPWVNTVSNPNGSNATLQTVAAYAKMKLFVWNRLAEEFLRC